MKYIDEIEKVIGKKAKKEFLPIPGDVEATEASTFIGGLH